MNDPNPFSPSDTSKREQLRNLRTKLAARNDHEELRRLVAEDRQRVFGRMHERTRRVIETVIRALPCQAVT